MGCRAQASIVSLVLVVYCAGCVSTSRQHERKMHDVFPDKPKRTERILSRKADQDGVEQLLALARIPGRTERGLQAELERALARTESSAALTTGAAELAIPGACMGVFCAGVGTESLAPEALQPVLPDRPDPWLLRLLTGSSEPPLAGFFSRLRKNPFGLVLRLWFPEHFYAHIFKDRDPPTGDPGIQAKALVIRDQDGTSFYWVKADLIGAFQDIRSDVLDKLQKHGLTDIDEDNFLFSATHTHSGVGAISPRLMPMLFTVDLHDDHVYQGVVNAIVHAVLCARRDLQPAKLGTGTVDVSNLTYNRRKHCQLFGDDSDSPPDPKVGIVRIDRTDDSALATVFNFAIHPVSETDDNMELHPDNVGFAEAYLEDAAIRGGTALFFNGTEGDVSPVRNKTTKEIGDALGLAVKTALSAIPTTTEIKLESTFCKLEDPEVSADHCEEKLEPLQIWPLKFIELPKGSGCFLDRGTMPMGPVISFSKLEDPPLMDRQGAVMAGYRIDETHGGNTKNTLVLTLPGEPITDVGKEIRDAIPVLSGFEQVWLFGVSNAHMGYIATEDEWAQGGYETGFFGFTQGTVMKEISIDLATLLVP